jgi:hypothetical protein
VLKAGHYRHLALEVLAEGGVGGDVRVHHLDDDLFGAADLPAEENFPHAAFAQKPDRLVLAEIHLAGGDHVGRSLRDELTGPVSNVGSAWPLCQLTWRSCTPGARGARFFCQTRIT